MCWPVAARTPPDTERLCTRPAACAVRIVGLEEHSLLPLFVSARRPAQAPATEDGERYCIPCFDVALGSECIYCDAPAWEPGAGVCEDHLAEES